MVVIFQFIEDIVLLSSTFYNFYQKVSCKSYFCSFETDILILQLLFIFYLSLISRSFPMMCLGMFVFIMLQVYRAFKPVTCYHLSVLEKFQLVSLQILFLLLFSFLHFWAPTCMSIKVFQHIPYISYAIPTFSVYLFFNLYSCIFYGSICIEFIVTYVQV